MPKLQSSPFQKHHFIFSLACGSFFVSPAYAGKSWTWRNRPRMIQDHPRVCGEKLLTPSRNQSHLGSPPRMRGKEDGLTQRGQYLRITPAYAGKSSRSAYTPYNPAGSPLRMRGKAQGLRRVRLLHGITPAYAGKRGRCCPDRLRCWDHPRVCGEKRRPMHHSHTLPGSPPRMRGKEPVAKSSITKLRITPAYAGKSRENTADTSR